MKFEAGKCYRMRNGRKAQVDHDDGCVNNELIGVEWTRKGEKEAIGWNMNGRLLEEDEKSNLDLVALWDEPTKIWVQLCKESISAANGTRHIAAWSEYEDVLETHDLILSIELTQEQAKQLRIKTE